MQQDLIIRFEKPTPINIKTKQDQIGFDLKEKINVVQIVKHSELKGLDFESSGHTGFASEKQLNLLKDETVPKRLNALESVKSSDDRSSMLLYVDNKGKSEKIAVSDMLSKIIRTSNVVPSDMQVGEYLFKEIKEE